jgi:hypothetical protein
MPIIHFYIFVFLSIIKWDILKFHSIHKSETSFSEKCNSHFLEKYMWVASASLTFTELFFCGYTFTELDNALWCILDFERPYLLKFQNTRIAYYHILIFKLWVANTTAWCKWGSHAPAIHPKRGPRQGRSHDFFLRGANDKEQRLWSY